MFTSYIAARLNAALQAEYSLSVRFEATIGRDFEVLVSGDDVTIVIKSKRARNVVRAFNGLVASRFDNWHASLLPEIEPVFNDLDDDAIMFMGERFLTPAAGRD